MKYFFYLLSCALAIGQPGNNFPVSTGSNSVNMVALNPYIFVSINGNDTWPGTLTQPKRTCYAAQAYAVANQTIRVMPGTYAVNNLGKDHVDWYFEKGANLTFAYSNNFPIIALFSDDPNQLGVLLSTPLHFNIYGHVSYTGSASFLWATGSNSTFNVEADYLI